MIKAVFFDVYGTLAGFQPSRYEVQSRACADFGIQVTPEGILRGYAAADAYMSEQTALRPLRLRDAEEREAFFAEYELLVLRGNGIEVSKAQALDIWRSLRKIPYALVAFDDVLPALRQLKPRGLTLGLISNIDRDGAELAESLGLASYLDFTVTSGEVGAEKPDPPSSGRRWPRHAHSRERRFTWETSRHRTLKALKAQASARCCWTETATTNGSTGAPASRASWSCRRCLRTGVRGRGQRVRG